MKEYIPSSLRVTPKQRREVMFGIGIQYRSGEFGMTHGPAPAEEELLEIIPEEKACLIRFNADGTDKVLWEWVGDRWVGKEE